MKWTRTISLLLVLALCLSFTAFASEDEAAKLFAGKWVNSEYDYELNIRHTGSAFTIEATAWASESNKAHVWLINALYSNVDGMLHYDNCLSGIRTFSADKSWYTDSFEDLDESGYFALIDGEVIWYKEGARGGETFIFQRVGNAPVTQPPAAAEPKIPFADVKESDYFYDAVVWCYENKITAGVSATEFAPQGTVTRAQVVSFLWRMAGEKTVANAETFTDVEKGSWYEKAVQWAVAEGITVGTGEGKFSPNQNCTRGQVVTFLYRMFGEPKPNGLGAYTDVPANEYYAAAINWATENGIITEPTKGTKKDTFEPMGAAKRQDMIVFLYGASKYEKSQAAGSVSDMNPNETALISWDTFLGTWTEEIAGRCKIDFYNIGSEYYTVSISWGDSAATTYFWTMFATFENGRMVYKDAQMWHRTYTSSTVYEDILDYSDGSGYFAIQGEKLIWNDEKEHVASGSYFVRIPE